MDLSRREFVLAGTASLASLDGGVVSRQVDSTDDEYRFSGVAQLLGPADARPEPNSEFFDDKLAYAYLYQATDAKVLSYIKDGDSAWTDLGTSDFWGDTDDDNYLEAPNFDGIEVDDAVVGSHNSEEDTLTATAVTATTTTVSFQQTYDRDTAANSVGIETTGGLAGVVIAFWSNRTTDANGNVDGMSISWRNETTTDTTIRWFVSGRTI
jgi:hypothetical protein